MDRACSGDGEGIATGSASSASWIVSEQWRRTTQTFSTLGERKENSERSYCGFTATTCLTAFSAVEATPLWSGHSSKSIALAEESA